MQLIIFCLVLPLQGFLELINNMLTSGMVPALYPDDEKELIIGNVGKNISYLFIYIFSTYLNFIIYVFIYLNIFLTIM